MLFFTHGIIPVNSSLQFSHIHPEIHPHSVFILPQSLPLFVCPPVHMDKVIILPPIEFELPLVDGSGLAKVTVPCAHTGPGPVNTRLISYQLRHGQVVISNITKFGYQIFWVLMMVI